MTEDEVIEDALAQVFALTLGVHLPHERCLKNMISWIKLRSKKEQAQLTEEYVYKSVPDYINFLFDKS